MTDITPPKSRNDPCPCGSSKRYKACHGLIAASTATSTSVGQMPLQALMEQALAAQLAKRLPEAERLYREALRIDPDQPDCLHMLGVVRMQRLDLVEGRELIARAGQLTGWQVSAIRHNYGHLLSGFMSGRAPGNLAARRARVLAERIPRRASSGTFGVVVIATERSQADMGQTLASVAALHPSPSQVLVASAEALSDNIPQQIRVVPFAAAQTTAQTLRSVLSAVVTDFVIIVQAGDTVLSGVGDAVRDLACEGAEWAVCAATVSADSRCPALPAEVLANGFMLADCAERLGAALIADDGICRLASNLVWRTSFLTERLAESIAHFRELVWSAVWHSEPRFCKTPAVHVRDAAPQAGAFWRIEPARFDRYLLDACADAAAPNALAPCRALDGASFLKRALRLGIATQLDAASITRLDALAADNDAVDVPLVAEGVDFIGFVKAENGLGESLRLLARACEAESVPFGLANIALDMGLRQNESSLDAHLVNRPVHRTRVICANPDSLGEGNYYDGALALPSAYDIGYWYWELEDLPPTWADHGNVIDELWVATDFVAAAARKVISQPVIKLPPPIAVPSPSRIYQRSEFGLGDHEFVFLFTFDFGSFPARKNPEAVVRAFRRAFDANHANARLIVKGHRGHAFPKQRNALIAEMAHDPRITLMEATLSRDALSGLQSVIDCYVSLHRSEGLGLGMAECMALGKPVIATAYSGNLDFTRPENTLLVDYHLTPVRDGEYLEWEGQHWAEPSVEHAAAHMRRLYDDRAFASALGARGQKTVLEEYSVRAAGARIRSRLDAINANLVGQPHQARRVRYLRRSGVA